jgi:DNA-binding response OmpR family regulator
MTILLVEDDEDDTILFFEAVRDFDPTITFAAAPSAEKALSWLRDLNNPLPGFIFLDLRMPGLSGRQCLVEIKKDPRLAPVPVIVYTTSKDVRESIVLKELGAAHFMSKPVSPEEVYYMVSFVLGEQWVAH